MAKSTTRKTQPAAERARRIERVLLRVGPEARIVRIDDRLGGPDLATEAAERILARYR